MERGESLSSWSRISVNFQLVQHFSNKISRCRWRRLVKSIKRGSLLCNNLKSRTSRPREIRGELTSSGEKKAKEWWRWSEWMRKIFWMELSTNEVWVVWNRMKEMKHSITVTIDSRAYGRALCYSKKEVNGGYKKGRSRLLNKTVISRERWWESHLSVQDQTQYIQKTVSSGAHSQTTIQYWCLSKL